MDASLTSRSEIPGSVRPRLSVAHVGDVANVGRTLVPALVAAGLRADLMEPGRPGSSRGRLVRALSAPLRLWSLLALVPRLRTGRYDLIHVHGAWRAIVAVVAGRPFVIHIHGTDLRSHQGFGPRAFLTRRLLRRALGVYCATPDLLALVYTERPDARFLPNPIDTVLFSPYQEALVASDRDLLVGVRLDPAKGLDAVLAILTSLRELRPQTTLTIVAQGRGARAALGAAGPRAEAVLPRAHSAMPDLLRAHRVALGQWQVGAIGNYELEALACGIPVAARFAYPEAYDRPPPLIVGDRPEATAAAIATLLDDAQLRARMAGDARRWLVDHHDVGLIAAAVSADYRRWLEDVRDPA